MPLLLAIVNATAVARGHLPLHASAFTVEGKGVLVAGWSKGGKTEVLLSAMRNGAIYVGDEWVYVTPERMQGVPEPIRLWDWQLAELPEYAATLTSGERRKLRALQACTAICAVAARGLPGVAGRTAHRLTAVLERQRNVRVEPHRLFGASRCSLRGRADVVVLVGSHTAPTTSIERIDPLEVADRMLHSLQEEQAPLRTAYNQFRFVHPDRANPLLDDYARHQQHLLREALRGKEAYLLLHPYPPHIPSLFDEIREVL